MDKTKTVSMSLKRETIAEIDRRRMLTKRSSYIQDILERALGKTI